MNVMSLDIFKNLSIGIFFDFLSIRLHFFESIRLHFFESIRLHVFESIRLNYDEVIEVSEL